MKNLKTYSTIFLFFVAGMLSLHAQNFVVGKSFVRDGNVYLRCAPSNGASFNNCKEKVYLIKRIEWKEINLPDSSRFRTATSVFYIKPVKDDDFWEALINKKEAAAIVYNFIYAPATTQKPADDMGYGLAMISCDFDVELAEAAGLFYKDKNVAAGRYAYLIQPADPKFQKTIKPAIVLVNAGVNDQLMDIDSVKLQKSGKEVKLTWNEERLQSDYTGYFIERSEDGKTFTQLNEKPHIQIRTQYEKEKKDIVFNDIKTEYNKIYHYRVRGLGFFGITGNYSPVVKCKLIKPLNGFPIADSVYLIGDTVLDVNWRLPKEVDQQELVGFDIWRSTDYEGTYTKINASTLPKETRSYKDLHAKPSNYYKVLMYSIYGDSAYSHAMMGLLPDITPPLVPKGLKGKIDSTGKITLSWIPNNEKDLKGYRIFRNNAMNEEPVEITKTILTDTIYKDSVSLQTTSEDVFYFMTAVDNVFNNSAYTKPIKLKRPDKIKPVAAHVVMVSHTDVAITLKWIPSTSKDVQRYELYRSIGDSVKRKIKEWSATDTLTQFADAQLSYGNYYNYEIKVVDDDGNFSVSTAAPHFFDTRVRPAIKKISYKVNLETKSILLNWEYPEKELYSFVIYKAKKGEAFKIVKTLKGNIFLFEDKQLFIGNKYVYKIKANFNSGAESFISQEIEIEF